MKNLTAIMISTVNGMKKNEVSFPVQRKETRKRKCERPGHEKKKKKNRVIP